jgi:hypothetical protein
MKLGTLPRYCPRPDYRVTAAPFSALTTVTGP